MKPEERRPGILYVVSTPIGNLEDITLRALRVLKEVDLIAAEDTRRTRQLLTHYGIHKPLISYHEYNRRMREKTLLQELREGKNIALVTDAGTPGISDPGEDLVRGAIQESIPLVPIPGPAALVSALSVSGLPTESFLFYGFLPSKAAARKKWLSSLRDRPETLVFYESPRRLGSLLEDAAQILGDRRVVVAREMTKVYEEVYRGTITEVLGQLGEEEVKGEVTIILEGCTLPPKADASLIVEALKHYSREIGLSMKESVARVAEELRVSRKQVYQESLRLKEESER
jgi:16S rRNA (cytidine1402-2'-O)-methyltransferase